MPDAGIGFTLRASGLALFSFEKFFQVGTRGRYKKNIRIQFGIIENKQGARGRTQKLFRSGILITDRIVVVGGRSAASKKVTLMNVIMELLFFSSSF